MINPFTQFNLKPSNIFKIIGLVILAVIVITFGVRLVGSSVKPLIQGNQSTYTSEFARDSVFGLNVAGEGYSGGGMALEKASLPELSVRNIAPVPPYDPGTTTGNTAEQFEVRDYRATIETRDVKKTCARILDLKSLSYVIFENANEYDRGCGYVFKVEKSRTEEILTIIKSLEPKQLSVNTHTVKSVLDDFTSQQEILEKKQKSIEETLESAIGSYDEISKLAAQTRDAQSLANVIESKLRIIERLTQERLNVSEQLDRLVRSKAEQLDRVEYTYFNINVVENKFVDGESIKDSWKTTVKTFVRDVNKIAQDISIRLVLVLLVAFQYVLYLFIIVVVAKYVWKGIKKVWKGNRVVNQ